MVVSGWVEEEQAAAEAYPLEPKLGEAVRLAGMLQPYRDQFNSRYTSAGYSELLLGLRRVTRANIEFRVSETPCFFSHSLIEELAETGRELTHQLVDQPGYRRESDRAVPERYRVPNENVHPNFMTVDFGLARAADGSLQPKLVELQAFPSVYGYQDVLARQYVAAYGLDPDLRWLLGGHDEESYWALLRKAIVGSHDPENVVLMDIDPEHQKTLPDFRVYEDRLKIATVDVAKLRKEGNRLYYEQGGERGGRWIPINRIYNRAIVDEMERKKVELAFDHRDELDVEWAGHPNWYFRISKFSLPYLDHPSVPKAVFLDEWFRERGSEGREIEGLPLERERLLLKPLYSFAGQGIQFAPSDETLRTIPSGDRHLYLLQQRVNFEPVIETPHGMTQAEVRIMYVWPDDGKLEPVIGLVRLGRGLMMGVDHNRNQEWVGGSAALFPRV